MKKSIAAAVMAVGLAATVAVSAQAASYTLPYAGHVQDIGWQSLTGDGGTAGTEGQGKRLEMLNVVFPGVSGRAHVQDLGWSAWHASDSLGLGTTGQSKRLEAIQFQDNANFSVQCQAHVQNKGWMPWVSGGAVCGTVGQGLRLEAVRLKLVQK